MASTICLRVCATLSAHASAAMMLTLVAGTVDENWVALTDAGKLLGVSVDTVRRRLRQGQLESRKVPTRHGPAWQVNLHGVERQQYSEVGSADPTSSAELVALVGQLFERITDLSQQVGYLRARVELAEAAISRVNGSGIALTDGM